MNVIHKLKCISYLLLYLFFYIHVYVTRFDKTRFPCTQQEDTLFTVTLYIAIATGIVAESYTGYFAAQLVSMTCQTSVSAWVVLSGSILPAQADSRHIYDWLGGWP